MARRLVVVVAAACAACGDDGPSIKPDDAALAMQHASCERLARCGLFPDVETCNASLYLTPRPSFDAALMAGTVRYHGNRAKQCVDAMAAVGCDLTQADNRNPPEACGQMYTGTLRDGTDCYFDEECSSGRCTIAPGCMTELCCIGSCRASQPPAGVDEACEDVRDCAIGLFCGRDHVCHELNPAGGNCDHDDNCAYGLVCINPRVTMPGTCRPAPHLGEPCPYLRCADEGLRCDEATTTCVPLGLPGDRCATFQDCSPYLECDDATTQCRLLPDLGEQCTSNCRGAAWCSKVPPNLVGICAEPQASTSPCTANNECASFYCPEGPLFDACTEQPICM